MSYGDYIKEYAFIENLKVCWASLPGGLPLRPSPPVSAPTTSRPSPPFRPPPSLPCPYPTTLSAPPHARPRPWHAFIYPCTYCVVSPSVPSHQIVASSHPRIPHHKNLQRSTRILTSASPSSEKHASSELGAVVHRLQETTILSSHCSRMRR